jgi:hypothetical protein
MDQKNIDINEIAFSGTPEKRTEGLQSFDDLLNRLIEEKRPEVGDLYAWYEKVGQEWETEFGIGVKQMTKDQAMLFFKEGIRWWNDKKPELPKMGKPIPVLDFLQTRVCLAQIGHLTKNMSKHM